MKSRTKNNKIAIPLALATMLLGTTPAYALTIGESSIDSGSVLTIGAESSFTDTTESTSSTTGSLITAGGVGIAKDLRVGGEVYQDDELLKTPAGVVSIYAGAAAPDGYLLCNGAAVSRTTYSDLFAAIGTTYGVGDGATTFNIPDFRGRVAIGVSETYARGSTGGSATVTLTTNELPAHTHTGTTDEDGSHTHNITDPGHTHNRLNAKDDDNGSNNVGQAPVGDANENYVTGHPTESATTGISINAGGAHTHDFTTNSTGDGEAFSILNPYLAVNYIIKY